MAYIPYTETDEYQKEIAEQYKKRAGNVSADEVILRLRKLGFNNVKAADLQTASAGNINAVFLTPELVIKTNKVGDNPHYYANKVVRDHLADKAPVVEVLAYDYFDKTPSEILVMKRSPGQCLLDTIFDLKQGQVIAIFKQVLAVIKQLQTIKFKDFGWVDIEDETYSSYPKFLKSEFQKHSDKIKQQKLAGPDDLAKVEKYFYQYLHIFDDETPVFVHIDTHMGNILYVGDKLTALIDFDRALKAPYVHCLSSLLGFIGDPQQYTEGSEYFAKYKDKNFKFLLPVLRQELKELFADPLVLKKLNLIFISEGLKWAADGWSEIWAKEMIKNILADELAETGMDLQKTYYAKLLAN